MSEPYSLCLNGIRMNVSIAAYNYMCVRKGYLKWLNKKLHMKTVLNLNIEDRSKSLTVIFIL